MENFDEDKRRSFKNVPKPNFELASVVTKDDLTFKLFNNENPSDGIEVNEDTIATLVNNNAIPTKVFVHGWLGSENKLWYLALRKEYLRNGNYNIIWVNWTKPANLSYSVACASVGAVAEQIAKLLIASKIKAEKIHLIGHSLGAQVAGFTGKAYKGLTNKKLGRITGLDTAGPGWEHPDLDERQQLNKDDALFVDVHHSDIHLCGYAKPIGHIDFYPNGGANQPGTKAGQGEKENSNHDRAVWYFVESVALKTKATEADFQQTDEWTFEVSPKENGKVIIFEEGVSNISGIFYFETNDQRPYLQAIR